MTCIVVGLKSSIVFFIPTIKKCLLSFSLSFAKSKTRALCFVDKARLVLDLRVRVGLPPLSKGAYARNSLSTKEALERASSA